MKATPLEHVLGTSFIHVMGLGLHTGVERKIAHWGRKKKEKVF